MKRIIREAGSGKTRELLEYAINHDAIVVCKSPDDIRDKAFEYGYVGLTFITYDEFINRSWAYQSKAVAIDDLDEYLVALGNIVAFGMRQER